MEPSKQISSEYLGHSTSVAKSPKQGKSNVINRIFFPNTVWFLFLLIPFIAIGFWPGYWSKLFEDIGLTSIMHIHNALMMAWVAMSLAQPLLILKKKVQWHRLLGKTSYVLMPLVLISLYFLMQERYLRRLARMIERVASGEIQMTSEQIYSAAAASLDLGLVYSLLLAGLYALAIIYRKRILYHATFMFGAILTALGPSVDRIIFQIYSPEGLVMNYIASYATLTFTILLFGALAWYQKRKGYSSGPALITMCAYIGGVLLIEFGSKTWAWQVVVESLFTS
ncbi:hypothetical protein [Cognataquiflexum rubidum]|uniref:hypothetical protein n=1 Tax=Cognataquiflexum rubidum TaxID=2922273 RepID=UPI001F13FB9B|nr:hypothetical protein [Cognataquiflexum rubidum]MCH6235726.1 hypothetical protein [Cognataquiflexum rubidum]